MAQQEHGVALQQQEEGEVRAEAWKGHQELFGAPSWVLLRVKSGSIHCVKQLRATA